MKKQGGISKRTGSTAKERAEKAPKIGAKEAPFDSPKKEWWRMPLYVLGISAFVFTVVIGVQLLLGIPLALILPKDVFNSSIFNVIFSVITYGLALVLVVYAPPRIFKNKIKKSSRDSLGLRGLPTWTDLGLAPVGYVASILIAMGITMLFNFLPWFNGDEVQDLGYSHYMVGVERGVVFLLLAVIAPIIEEIIFRGWLYGKLRVRIPKWVAVIVTSLAFGLVHLQWNVGISVFAMSVVTCTLREITGTIYAGTLVHIINNSVAFYLVYVAGM